jgi:hypothetical protein
VDAGSVLLAAPALHPARESAIREPPRRQRRGRRIAHILVPGYWSVQRGHDVAERVERALREAVGNATVFTHLEPLEDPASFADTGLDPTPTSSGATATNGSTEIVLAETCVALNVAARSVLGIPQAAGTPQGNRSLGRGQLQAEYVKQRGANRA